MIIKFKIFEARTSSQEVILNKILDKIQEFGKDKLTPNELNFLDKYPDAEFEEDEISNQDSIQSRLDDLGADLAQRLSEVDDDDDDDDEYDEYDNRNLEDIWNDEDYWEKESNPTLSTYSTENFWFNLKKTDEDELSNTFIISGEMVFIKTGDNNIKIDGYFVVNMETHQTFPYFMGSDGETVYDYAAGNEQEFDDFLEMIYDRNKKE